MLHSGIVNQNFNRAYFGLELVGCELHDIKICPVNAQVSRGPVQALRNLRAFVNAPCVQYHLIAITRQTFIQPNSAAL